MGTSTSSRGPSNNSPLVPPWADVDGEGPGPEPDPNRFKGFRTTLGRFVASGNASDLRKAIGRYARTATGGSTVGPRRFGAMAQSGAAAVELLAQLRFEQDKAPVDLLALQGASTSEALDKLVDALVPENGDADRIRTALNDALVICLQGVEVFDFASITDDFLAQLLVEYMTLCVFEDIMLSSRDAFAKTRHADQAQARENDLLTLVKVVVDNRMRPLLATPASKMSQGQLRAVQIDALAEVWREWEAFEE